MKKIEKYSIITLILSGLSIIALLISHLALALTDIYHGGEDNNLEWIALRISAAVILAFIISTVFTLRHVLRIMREKSR